VPRRYLLTHSGLIVPQLKLLPPPFHNLSGFPYGSPHLFFSGFGRLTPVFLHERQRPSCRFVFYAPFPLLFTLPSSGVRCPNPKSHFLALLWYRLKMVLFGYDFFPDTSIYDPDPSLWFFLCLPKPWECLPKRFRLLGVGHSQIAYFLHCVPPLELCLCTYPLI